MKRKTTNLVIVLLSFLTAALIALAVFMTWFTKEQTAFLEKSLRRQGQRLTGRCGFR